jgi:hypothetical protein
VNDVEQLAASANFADLRWIDGSEIVFATARKLGYPIQVLTDRSQMMDRYAFLLVE